MKKKRQIIVLLLLPLPLFCSLGGWGELKQEFSTKEGNGQSPRVGDDKDRKHRLLITQTTVLWVSFATHFHI